MEINIVKSQEEWRAALTQTNHDWYHTWEYHQLSVKKDESAVLVTLEFNGKLVALPLILRTYKNVKDATSVYGYPGWVTSTELSNEEQLLLLNSIKVWAQQNNVISIFTRLNPLLNSSLPESSVEVESSGEVVVVDLTIPLDEQKKRYRKNYRNLINRLVKDGFEAYWDNSPESIDKFIQIYNETMDSLEASESYYFDRDYYDSLCKIEGAEVRFYFVSHDGEITCGGIFVFYGDFVHYHLSGTKAEFKRVAPNRLMIDKVRIDATEMGKKSFLLGGGLGGMRDSLFDFKFGFSKQAISFNTVKMISDETHYLAFCEEKGISIEFSEGFFPAYRSKD